MRRPFIAALAASSLVIAIVAPTTLAQEADDPEAAQEEVTEQTVPEPPETAVELRLGERYTSAAYDLEAQALFTALNPDREEKTEVRIAFALRNNLETPLGFSDSSFAADPAYPRLVLVDALDLERPLTLVDMPAHAVGQSDVRHIQGGLTARWTIGFTVPTDATGELSLIARDLDGNDLARWNLLESVPRGAWEPPPLAEPISFGDTIDWTGDGLEVTPVDFGTLVCGDPDVEYVTQIFALRFAVGNRDFQTDALWPPEGFPDTAAVARWADGASAAEVLETYSVTQLPFERTFADQAIIPSTVEPDYQRVLLFGVPRDGRLGSVDDAPDGVLLNVASDLPRWLDLSGDGTLPVDPGLCFEGFLDFLPGLAFGPSVPFEAAEGPLPVEDAAAQDEAAEALLARALIATAEYHVANGTFLGMTSAALEATGVGVDFTNDIDLLVPGVVAWDALDADVVVLLTESESGLFFCAGAEAFGRSLFGSGEVALDTAAGCVIQDALPEPPPEEPAAGEGEGEGEAG